MTTIRLILLFGVAIFLIGCGPVAAPLPTDLPTLPPPTPTSPPTSLPPTEPPAPTATPPPTETPTTQSAPAGGGVSFANDVYPILRSRCLNCHGGERISEGLSVATYEALMAGSKNGPVLLPGDPQNSELVQVIVSGEMPKRGPKLTPQQIQIIIDWITQGAPNN